MPHRRRLLLTGFVCVLAGCGSDPEKPRSLGNAFVGPLSLELRKDTASSSEPAAVLKHGERVELLTYRRRLVKVRNVGGTEGWVDTRSLLTARQLSEFRKLNQAAAKLPSQGKAIVYDALNMHTEPNRGSPSPYQIQPNEPVDVVAHVLTERSSYYSLIDVVMNEKKAPVRKPRKRKGKNKEPEEKLDVPPPPPPPAPKPPDNWLDLSRIEYQNPEDAPKSTAKLDDWSLVRNAKGEAGWVLTRMLSFAIPDEVAQYAEGHRITSYFSLGEVRDEDSGETKHHWLWTTISKPTQDYQFDGLRVFIYNARRHRYETAYRERDMKGYYPVTTQTAEVSEGKKTFKVPGFTIIVEDENRQRWKRSYAFQGYRVTRLGSTPVETPKPAMTPNDTITQILAPPPKPAAQQGSKSAFTKLKEIFNR